MAENTKTDELRNNVEAIIIVDDYVHGIKISTLDKIMQLINSEVHQVLDRLSSNLVQDISQDPAFKAERDKYPLNKEES